MLKWSESLLKTRIEVSVFEIDATADASDIARVKDLKFFCGGVFETAERIDKVRAIVQKKAREKPASSIVKSVVQGILEELSEIESDRKFAKSRRGKFILFANDWIQPIYAEIRPAKRFEDLFFSADPEKEQIVVQGSVANAIDLIDCIKLVEKFTPGVPVEFRVKLNMPGQ